MSIYKGDKNNWFFWIFCENKKGTISEVKMKLEIEVLFIAAMPGGAESVREYNHMGERAYDS